MKPSSPQNVELLKAAMGNKTYLKSINENEINQLTFLTILQTNKFTHQQIQELISIVQDEQVRSLLIVHLLSQPEYLVSLKGESVLTRLTNHEIHKPSRLNALVHQLDIKILTVAMIDKLPPETAVSLLCSVPHFHQLKENQIDALLKNLPHPEVIIYWLNHFSSMPNAHSTLGHMMKCADTYIITELYKMDTAKKEAIITKIIEHLELFNPDTKILYEQNEEKHLILALSLFLNGHQHKAYVSYINRLTDRLLIKNHQFSLQAIQLLISLNEKQEFTELNTKTAYLTNHYLRTNAQSGEIGIFYHSGRANSVSMIQPFQFKPFTPDTATTKGFLTNLLGVKPEVINEQRSGTLVYENSLVAKLVASKKQLTAFDYYLIHFKGDISKINKVINDYLGFYAREGCTGNRRKTLHQSCDFMVKTELDLPTREAIFTSFLCYPDLYDKKISYMMFLFDAQRTIQYFGLKGGKKNYTLVVDLCTWALKKLDPYQHTEIINIAKRAQSEAELELSFNEDIGFFASLFRRLRRCWISGWTGFFSPNLPMYVAPASTNQTQELEVPVEKTQLLHKLEPNLLNLLTEITLPLTQEKLDELAKALSIFSIKAKPISELEIRKKFNDIFLQLLEDSKENEKINSWLMENQHHFIANRFCLLELILIKGPRTEVESLLSQIDEDSHHFQQITDELVYSLLEPKAEKIPEKTVPHGSDSTILETTTELVYNAWNWGVTALFKPADNAPATPTPEEPSPALML